MKLYSYSAELLTFVEMKWIKTKIIASAILIVVVLFGIIALTQSISPVGQHVSNPLSLENNLLQQHISVILPRVNAFRIRIRQLNEYANSLHLMVDNPTSEYDSAFHFASAAISPFLLPRDSVMVNSHSLDQKHRFGKGRNIR